MKKSLNLSVLPKAFGDNHNFLFPRSGAYKCQMMFLPHLLKSKDHFTENRGALSKGIARWRGWALQCHPDFVLVCRHPATLGRSPSLFGEQPWPCMIIYIFSLVTKYLKAIYVSPSNLLQKGKERKNTSLIWGLFLKQKDCIIWWIFWNVLSFFRLFSLFCQRYSYFESRFYKSFQNYL